MAMRSFLLFLLTLAAAPLAAAHGLGVDQLGLQLTGSRLMLVATPGVAALSEFDRDRDGRLSVRELQEQRAGIAAALDRLIDVRDGQGRAVELTLADVILPVPDKARAPLAATHVKVIRKYRFAAAPTTLELRSSLGARLPGPLVVLLKADAAPLQSALLSGRQQSVRFALGGRAGWRTFGQWLVEGMGHILGGTDHLAFLLLLVWGAGRAGTAAAWLTAFTLGHSLTLALVLLGVILFPGWAEAAIAASIVATGLVRLHGSREARPGSGARGLETVLAAGFGLVHGLGFAGAVAGTALVSEQRWSTLAGFNLGIELGQLLVALAFWPLLARLRRAPAWVGQSLLGGTTLMGLFWLLQRL